MKTISLILIILFSSSVYAQQTYGGGGFVVNEASFKQAQDDGPVFFIGAVNPGLNRIIAANSMYETILAHQELNGEIANPDFAAQIISEVYQSLDGDPILAIFDPVSPARVAMFSESHGDFEHVSRERFLKQILEPVTNSEVLSESSSHNLWDNFKIYSY